MPELSVVTLNIWNRGEPWDDRVKLIRKGIAQLKPDLVALQEVIRIDDSFDQAKQIGESFGYHSVFGRHPESVWPFGNAILSRWPIARSAVFPLPNGGTEEHRTLVFAEIDSPHGLIPFFSTHLNWKAHEGYVRAEQVKYLAERVTSLCPITGFPPIIGGDFNADPDSDEIRYMRGLTALGAGKTVYFADCHWAAGDGPGLTWNNVNTYARYCHEPNRRIDYVFVRGPDDRFRGQPLESRVCFDEPDGDVWPSDHFGVFTRISA